MRRRPREEGDPDELPPHLVRYRPEDWVDAPAPDGPEFVAGCTVCAFWYAHRQWSEAHPDARLRFDFDAPDDPWHPELA